MIKRIAGVCAVVLGLLVASGGTATAATPGWRLTVTPNADYFVSGHYLGVYKIEAENIGDAPTDPSEPITIKDTLPVGTTVASQTLPDGEEEESVTFYVFGPDHSNPGTDEDLAKIGMCPSALECTYPRGVGSASFQPDLAPGDKLVMSVLVETSAGVSGPMEDTALVSGGGLSPATAAAENIASPDPAFGVFGFGVSPSSSSGAPYTQAGGHPYQITTELDFGTYSGIEASRLDGFHGWQTSGIAPVRDPKYAEVDLPPGLLANPQSSPHCALAAFFSNECSQTKDSVGYACLRLFAVTEGACRLITPVYNLQPQGAYPAEFGVPVANAPFVFITTGLRSGSDFGATATAVASERGLTRSYITLWGIPADESHNGLRGKECGFTASEFKSVGELEHDCERMEGVSGGGGPAEAAQTPFLTMPGECSGTLLTFAARYDSWQEPAEFAERSVTSPPLQGCAALHFEPTIEAHPTTDLADSPSGLEFDLHVPQEEAPEGLATPSLREATVKLPEGLTVNPSSGNGLAGCAPDQIGMTTAVGQTPAHFTEVPARCPEAAKIGTAEVNTPLLHNPLKGAVYLATPHQNPFSSLLAAYIVLEGEGLIIKLPGRIEADPATGQLTGKFLENPQTPFEDFHLDFFGGARGDLRTPALCGTYATTSVLTPYSAPGSGPPAEPVSEFELEDGGAACPHQASEEPNTPTFRAGTESPEAGRFSPFSLRLAREDGSQEISRIETTLPPGLTGRLAGVAECSDARLAVAQSREHEGGGAEELASPSCPSDAEVGTVQVGAGAGPTPLYVTGHAYLAGPYKGAPLSLAIITPAVAGPFDLGDVVVRTALFVEPETAQIKAVSDPIPHILDGIPLDVRSITLQMSRPQFTLNPTDCEELHLEGAETSVIGNVAHLSQRFQVGDCAALGFEPRLSLSLEGSTRHGGHPGLRAVLRMPTPGSHRRQCTVKNHHRHCRRVLVPAQANIAHAQVNLPGSEFIDQGNLNKVCTRPVLLEGACPAKSIYGKAKAWTPLLEAPLEGPVYLVGGFGYKLPALVAELDGQIRVLLVGKVDSGKNKGIRNTFEAVPDAPVEKFELRMKGGPKYSLLENSEDLCRKPQKATASFTAQNGKVDDLTPIVANGCGKRHKGHGHKGPGGSHGKGHARAGSPADALAALLARGW